MLKFIRTVDKSLEDFLILDLKTLGNLVDNVNDHSPDAFRYGKLRRVSCHFTEESADSFIGREASGRSKYVILHGSNSGTCNLGSKVAHLILAKSEIPFAVLEHDFQRPTHGIDVVGLLEFKLGVGCNQCVPVRLLISLCKEQTNFATGKLNIYSNLVASKATTELTSLFGVVEESNQCFCSIVLPVVAVLCLSHLNHTKVVALDMAGGNELDDLGTCEPTVCEDVVKVYLSGNKTLYHLYHERNLTLVILLDTFSRMAFRLAFLSESGIKLLLLKVVRAILAFFTDKTEVHEHLGGTISNTKEQSLEAENHLVLNVGEHLSNHLGLDASLRIVRVVNHQTYGSLVIPLCTRLSLVPELSCDIDEDFAPVIVLSRKKTIEHVLATVGYAT